MKTSLNRSSHMVNDLYESDPNYVPFGCGIRRCPGEFLTYEFIIECSKNLKMLEINIENKNEKILHGLQNIDLYKLIGIKKSKKLQKEEVNY